MKTYHERASYDWTEDSVRLILTPSPMAKATYFYVQEIGDFKTNKPYFTERRNLNSYLLIYTISGRGKLCYRNQTYSLGAGQCAWIDCMEYHYYETAGEQPWVFLWVHYNGVSALGYYDVFLRDGFQIIDVQDSFLIESTLRRLVAVNRKRDFTTEIISSQLIVTLLTELVIQNRSGTAEEIRMPGIISELMKYIDQHFMESLSLEQLSRAMGMSKYHLSRLFKQHVGQTIGAYILDVRLAYAKERLKYTNQPIEEITHAAGMHSASYFINCFKEREGQTPLQYRKRWS